MTKRTLLTYVALIVFTLPASAQTHETGLAVLGDWAYNTTYGNSAGVDLIAGIPVGAGFDCEPALQLTTAGIHTAALQTRALFPVERSSFYLKNRIVFKDIARSGMYDACLGLSLGWVSRHLDVEAGMFGRVMDNFGREKHSASAALCEPFNLLYSLTLSLRDEDSPWNVWASGSNVDIFQMERMWQPVISVGGRYDITDSLSIRLETVCKPTGMFHLNAEFYSISARAGVTFKL